MSATPHADGETAQSPAQPRRPGRPVTKPPKPLLCAECGVEPASPRGVYCRPCANARISAQARSNGAHKNEHNAIPKMAVATPVVVAMKARRTEERSLLNARIIRAPVGRVAERVELVMVTEDGHEAVEGIHPRWYAEALEQGDCLRKWDRFAGIYLRRVE